MGVLSLIILLAGAAGVFSQSFSEVPECAAACITDAILGTSCDAAALYCVCDNPYFLGYLAPCAKQNCSTGNEEITEFVVDTTCLSANPPVQLIPFANVTYIVAVPPTHAVTASSGTNVKAIVGGAVVGVLGLLLLVFGVWGFIAWRRRSRMQMIVYPAGKAGSLYEE